MSFNYLRGTYGSVDDVYRKRRRQLRPTVEDVMHYGRLIMEKDPFKEKAPREEDAHFRAMFGCGPQICLALWEKLVAAEVVPFGGTMMHLLWTFMYCKVYGKWKTMKKLTSTDPKTLRKWIKQFWNATSLLESDIVRVVFAVLKPNATVLVPHSVYWLSSSSVLRAAAAKINWKNRYKQDRSNDCLVSVDGTDFQIPFQGRRFKSHKFKFGSGLRYEVAVCIISGELVWIAGPYEPGIWNDITIFRNVLLSMLDEGERVEADDGYIGEAPRKVKCPASIGEHDPTTESMQSLVRRRHETINKRFKQWAILKNVYRGDITKHGVVFRFCAIVTQLAIERGEPLFSVDYEDPDYDNYYFEDEDESDDDP